MGVFGEAVTYSPKTGSPFPITAIFDEGNYDFDLSADAPGINTQKPTLGVQLSQFAAPPVQGDQLSLRGSIYVVREVNEDSHGGAKLLLNFVAPDFS